MKSYKLGCIFLTVSLICFGMVACSNTRTMDKLENRSTACQQPGSYFPNGEQRYILVDESVQYLGDSEVECFIYADKYMGTMYLYTIRHYKGDSSRYGVSYAESSTWDQIFYEDGSPMIYDGGVW